MPIAIANKIGNQCKWGYASGFSMKADLRLHFNFINNTLSPTSYTLKEKFRCANFCNRIIGTHTIKLTYESHIRHSISNQSVFCRVDWISFFCEMQLRNQSRSLSVLRFRECPTTTADNINSKEIRYIFKHILIQWVVLLSDWNSANGFGMHCWQMDSGTRCLDYWQWSISQ